MRNIRGASTIRLPSHGKVHHGVTQGEMGDLHEAVFLGGNIEINLFQIMFKNIHLHGITVGPREIQQQMNEFIAQHDIHPVIDREFDFEDSPGAIMGIKAGNHFGKIVINMDI